MPGSPSTISAMAGISTRVSVQRIVTGFLRWSRGMPATTSNNERGEHGAVLAAAEADQPRTRVLQVKLLQRMTDFLVRGSCHRAGVCAETFFASIQRSSASSFHTRTLSPQRIQSIGGFLPREGAWCMSQFLYPRGIPSGLTFPNEPGRGLRLWVRALSLLCGCLALAGHGLVGCGNQFAPRPSGDGRFTSFPSRRTSCRRWSMWSGAA